MGNNSVGTNKSRSFSCILSGNYVYQIDVNKNGDIILADYGNVHSWCSAGPSEAEFAAVIFVCMKGILDNDIDEFKKMRDFLSPRFKTMAEEVRITKMNEYDF